MACFEFQGMSNGQVTCSLGRWLPERGAVQRAWLGDRVGCPKEMQGMER